MGPSRDGVLIPSDDKEDEGERESEQFVGLGGGKASKKYSNQRKMNYSVMIGSVEDEASHLFADFEVNYSSVPNKRNSHNKSTKEPPTLKLISATHKISTTGDQFQFFQ